MNLFKRRKNDDCANGNQEINSQPHKICNKCICENMIESGIDMHNTTYKSIDYRGFTLNENYGTWDLRFVNDIYKSVEIFYCPFCGKKLNRWDWADNRREENFKKYIDNF